LSSTVTREEKGTICYHCGEDCDKGIHFTDEKPFCCIGCKIVYEILQENELSCYYDLEKNPGISFNKKPASPRYAFLENDEIVLKILDFSSPNLNRVTLFIPDIHCSSCIWLLENLYRLNSHIINSKVNFSRKHLSVDYPPSKLNLRELVELLSSIGYDPVISLESSQKKKKKRADTIRALRALVLPHLPC